MPLTKPRAYQIYDIDYKQSVRVVTVSNVTLAGGAPNAVDGVNLSLNNRILVAGQSNPVQNGIYYVTSLGTGANGTWTRSIDTDTTGELEGGTIVMVTEGVLYADTQWKLTTNDPITIGVTALTFVQNYLANSISYGQTSFAIGSANANATISVASTSNVAVFTTTGANVTGTISASGNVTGGNLISGASLSVTGRTFVASGNAAAPGITFSADTAQDTGFYWVSDGNIGVSTNGSLRVTFDNVGGVNATGVVSGTELSATNSQTNEGGQINLALPSSGSTLSGNVIVDIYQNRLRFFEGGGTNRGAYIDLTQAGAGVATNLLAGGGGGTPGGANTQVQFNDGGLFGGNGQFTYNKVTNVLTAGIIAANTNGAGTNFQVGDDAWIGDINLADTLSIRGQQNAANGYIVFGNANGIALGRAGTGPLTYGGAFSATGNITGSFLFGNGSQLTGIDATSIQNGTSNVRVVSSGGNVAVGIGGTSNVAVISSTGMFVTGVASVSGNVSGGNVAAATAMFSLGTIGASGNISGGNLIATTIVSAPSHIGTIVSVTGNINGGNLISSGTITTAGNIATSGANGVANIGAVGAFFNTVHARATSAQYADVAEYYAGDVYYEPGTVVVFGGLAEVTMSNVSADNAVAGVVSTNPAYIMNAGIQSQYPVAVALTGRVPTKVLGPVRKGNMMVSAANGYAQACAAPAVGTVIGKAIENFDGEHGTIEIVVGRL